MATAVEDVWPSPDGRRIVFQRLNSRSELKLYVSDASNTAELRIPVGEDSNKFDPAWSPSGRRIAFQNGYDIWAVDSAGKHAVRLTRSPIGYEDRCATWVNGGHAIAFVRDFQQSLP